MANRLDPIITQKRQEVAALKKMLAADNNHLINKIMRRETSGAIHKDFKAALQQQNLAVIAEIKRKSPSKGALAEIVDPILLAKKYIAGGANALSILTDELFFQGKLTDLAQVANAIKDSPVPILRKDFMIDEIQMAEAIAFGANAILCIVAVLKEKTKSMLEKAKALGLNVLVEIHDHDELQIALDAGADIIGVNNRDLTTFEVNTERALQLATDIPASIVKVAESGITTPEVAQQYYQAGFNAVLIGEALVKSSSPDSFIEACRHG